jgi:hypothetical protein
LPDAVNQTDQSQVTPEPQTEKRNPQLPEISALRQFREREASSANAQGQAREGQPAQEGAAQREGFIPRERFDQVNQRMQTAEQQAQQMQVMLQQFMMQQQQAQRVPTQHPGGMMNTASPQPQQLQNTGLPDFNDPNVAKEWQNKIANGGVKELVGLMRQVVEATGQPLLQQFQQQIQNQLSPIRNSFVRQQADQYASTRSQQDPTFQQVRPYFEHFVQEAVQRNPDLQLNQATLSTIEHVAKIQQQQSAQQFGGMGQFNPYGFPQFMGQQQYPQNPAAPFTERPGAAANLGQQRQTVSLTPQQRAAARGFGMTDEQYATKLRELGING